MWQRLRSTAAWLVLASAAAATAVIAAPAPAPPPAPPGIAFYYGSAPPVDALAQFDRIVVDPAHADAGMLAAWQARGVRAYAYLSVGERDPDRPGVPALAPADMLGANAAWGSQVVDLTSATWRRYLLDTAIAQLWKAGWRGLFLDTLDSYQAHVHGAAALARQQQALATLIRAIHARYPGIHLLLNRGFEVLPQVHDDVDGVVAESLFHGWDQARRRYFEVAPADRAWLLDRLRSARDTWHLPVTVIDYYPPAQRDEARADARRIAALGFAPWVSDPALDQVGVGAVEVAPREVLMLYSKDDPADPTDDISAHSISNAVAMPLEYLGYVPVYHEMHQPLPGGVLRGRYAGIVAWFSGTVPDPAAYRTWLTRQIDDGVPVALFGDPGTDLDGALAERLGLRHPDTVDVEHLQIARHDAMLGFEGMRTTVPPGEDGYLPTRADVTAHLTLCDPQHHCLAPVLTGPWGGIALNPWVLQSAPTVGQVGPDKNFFGAQSRWLLDPFRFLRAALHPPAQPLVDATTENGNRIASAHIDGDGFANRADMPGTPFAGAVIRDRILEHYDFPVTVSVIEGEVAPDGLNPKLAPQLEAIARSIFRLPNVEIATHTYSHPLDWLAIKPGMPSGLHNLPIPGYRFSFRRDLDGSVDYINTHLAPPGKRVRMVLWSGDAIPPEPAMQRVAALGLLEMNGGATQITRRYDSLTNVSPMTRPVGPYTQVYAPDMNEEVYTNGYRGPYWGFRDITQTFALTGSPRRLKPMSIYFHFFSGTRTAALDAVRRAFDYVLARPTLPMFESDYSRLVANFRQVGVARAPDGAWLITSATADRTLRLPPGTWPDLARSPGVVGVRDLPQGRYVALSGAARVRLVLRDTPPAVAYLADANGRVTHWQRDGRGFRLGLRGAVPLRVALGNVASGCTVRAPGATQERLADGRLQLTWRTARATEVGVACH